MHKALVPVLLLTAACLSRDADRSSALAYGTSESSFLFVYEAAVAEVPADTRQVRLWVPVPVDTRDQDIDAVHLNVDVRGQRAKSNIHLDVSDDFSEQTFGQGDGRVRVLLRDIQGGGGRSLCIEAPGGSSIDLELTFEVTRRETTGGGDATELELANALRPTALIPLDKSVAAVAASIKTSGGPIDVARELYDHTLERMRYEKPLGGGWGRGDAEWACDARFGNCTDFHSYFLGLARKKGIPARFEMGFPVPGGDDRVVAVSGYHCWAWFWADDEGWIPVDISEADKHPERADYYFGTLDADRVAMAGGRDLVLDPPPAQGPLNFFVYPYAEVDGKVWSAVEKSFKRVRH